MKTPKPKQPTVGELVTSHAALLMSCALWGAVFSKYLSFQANGIRRVSVAKVIADFNKCDKATLPCFDNATGLLRRRQLSGKKGWKK